MCKDTVCGAQLVSDHQLQMAPGCREEATAVEELQAAVEAAHRQTAAVQEQVAGSQRQVQQVRQELQQAQQQNEELQQQRQEWQDQAHQAASHLKVCFIIPMLATPKCIAWLHANRHRVPAAAAGILTSCSRQL